MLFEKSISYFTKTLYQHRTESAKKMSRQNLAQKDFRNRMKEKRSGGKRKPYY